MDLLMISNNFHSGASPQLNCWWSSGTKVLKSNHPLISWLIFSRILVLLHKPLTLTLLKFILILTSFTNFWELFEEEERAFSMSVYTVRRIPCTISRHNNITVFHLERQEKIRKNYDEGMTWNTFFWSSGYKLAPWHVICFILFHFSSYTHLPLRILFGSHEKK